MDIKKYAGLDAFAIFLDNLKNLFATKEQVDSLDENKSDKNHTHSEATQADAGFLSAEDKIQLDNGGIPIVTASSTDGVNYTTTVDGMDTFTAGITVTIIPDTTSTNRNAYLNINSLGNKPIRMPVTYNTSATSNGAIESWIVKNKPVTVQYDGGYWKTISIPRPSADYLYGSVPIENGGTNATTVEDARTNLDIYSKAETDSKIETYVNDSILGGTW